LTAITVLESAEHKSISIITMYINFTIEERATYSNSYRLLYLCIEHESNILYHRVGFKKKTKYIWVNFNTIQRYDHKISAHEKYSHIYSYS
jgi:hypothetical protein